MMDDERLRSFVIGAAVVVGAVIAFFVVIRMTGLHGSVTTTIETPAPASETPPAPEPTPPPPAPTPAPTPPTEVPAPPPGATQLPAPPPSVVPHPEDGTMPPKPQPLPVVPEVEPAPMPMQPLPDEHDDEGDDEIPYDSSVEEQ